MLDNVNGRGLTGFQSGNHDRWRMSHYAKTAGMIVNMAMVFTMPGCPFLYYGDELGMRYIPGIQTEGSGSRGGSRTPMQWERGKNLGFSSAEPDALYLPVDASTDAPVVSKALAGDNPLFNAVRELIALKSKSSALLADARFEVLHGEDDTFPLVFRRASDEEELLIALNPTDDSVHYAIPDGDYSVVWSFQFDEKALMGGLLRLPPVSALVAKKQESK